jgi:hypothetical protein
MYHLEMAEPRAFQPLAPKAPAFSAEREIPKENGTPNLRKVKRLFEIS